VIRGGSRWAAEPEKQHRQSQGLATVMISSVRGLRDLDTEKGLLLFAVCSDVGNMQVDQVR
jgi:hypothetical protein